MIPKYSEKTRHIISFTKDEIFELLGDIKHYVMLNGVKILPEKYRQYIDKVTNQELLYVALHSLMDTIGITKEDLKENVKSE